MTRDEIAHLYRDALPGWNVEVFTALEWEQRSAGLCPAQPVDYWTALEAKLARKGYIKEFKTKEQELLHRVSTSRVYASSVPRYELREQDGKMRLVTVGYWTEQSQEAIA